tara:strand:- start:1319 stop:2026 length:708 start_codon:yes stop_codon:yes gene_type:complete
MNPFSLDREIARLILLQRIELSTPFVKKLRKILGRYIFTNFVSKYLISKNLISKNYKLKMLEEFNDLKNHINFNGKKILSIGAGMCGLELIIKSNTNNCEFSIIEKNYVSKKVRYGWDEKNFEAYNNLHLLNSFLLNNGMKQKEFKIYDFDKDKLPIESFDLIISLYSLDYHYDFGFYKNYLNDILTPQTNLIFDTIRPNYFEKFFDSVKIIKKQDQTTHKSCRVICEGYKFNDK